MNTTKYIQLLTAKKKTTCYLLANFDYCLLFKIQVFLMGFVQEKKEENPQLKTTITKISINVLLKHLTVDKMSVTILFCGRQ